MSNVTIDVNLIRRYTIIGILIGSVLLLALPAGELSSGQVPDELGECHLTGTTPGCFTTFTSAPCTFISTDITVDNTADFTLVLPLLIFQLDR